MTCRACGAPPKLPLSTPDELADEPELAPLHILASATDITRRALLAAHPELIDRGDFLIDEPDLSARQYLAGALLGAIDNLSELVETYCAHLDHLAARRRPLRSDNLF